MRTRNSELLDPDGLWDWLADAHGQFVHAVPHGCTAPVPWTVCLEQLVRPTYNAKPLHRRCARCIAILRLQDAPVYVCPYGRQVRRRVRVRRRRPG